MDNPKKNPFKSLEGKVVILTGVSAGSGQTDRHLSWQGKAPSWQFAPGGREVEETAALCEKEGAEVLALNAMFQSIRI